MTEYKNCKYLSLDINDSKIGKQSFFIKHIKIFNRV